MARAAFSRPALADEPPNRNEDEGQFLKWLALAAEFAKTLAPYQSPRLLAHAIKTPATESCAAPGTDPKERLKNLVRDAIAADEITLKSQNAAENASAAEPENAQLATDFSAEDDADGVLVSEP